MGVRLNKVLSELNIGLQTAVDFLKNKKELGEVKDEMTPNTKISDEQYQALVGEFKGDKAVKTQADMIFTKKVKEKKTEKVEKVIEKKITSNKNSSYFDNYFITDAFFYEISAFKQPSNSLEKKTYVTTLEKPFKITIPKSIISQGVTFVGIKESETTPWRYSSFSDSDEILANIASFISATFLMLTLFIKSSRQYLKLAEVISISSPRCSALNKTSSAISSVSPGAFAARAI